MNEKWRLILKYGATWILAWILILLVTSVPRTVQATHMAGHLWTYHFDGHTYWTNIKTALFAPFTLFSPSRADNINQIKRHMPLTLFYILFAFIGAYLCGIIKGILDVFLHRNRWYAGLRGIAWAIDAVPMFGVIVLVELGSLYGEMYIPGFPISMVPDQSFIGGYILPGMIFLWPPMMYLSRLLQIAIIQEISEQYVLTARSKGLLRERLFWRHIYRNCLPKLIHEAPVVFTMLMSSLLALEYLSFRWGGMMDLFVSMGHGQLGQRSLYASPSNFDVPVVSTYLFLFALMTIVVQLITVLVQRRTEVQSNA